MSLLRSSRPGREREIGLSTPRLEQTSSLRDETTEAALSVKSTLLGVCIGENPKRFFPEGVVQIYAKILSSW